MPDMPNQGSVHDGKGASGYAVGARGGCRGSTGKARSTRRATVEHPFATLKMRMGATHFLMKKLPRVATEMVLHVLAYNITRVLNIIGIKPMLAAVMA